VLQASRFQSELLVESEGLDTPELLVFLDRIKTRRPCRTVRELKTQIVEVHHGSRVSRQAVTASLSRRYSIGRTVEKRNRQFSLDFLIDFSVRSASSSDHAPASIGSSEAVTRRRNSSRVSSSRFDLSNRSLVASSTGIDVLLT
jgi:hypothetical protein